MSNPIEYIRKSIASAQQANDRNAGLLFLATASTDGQPSVRTLLLRKIENRSLLILFSKHHQKWLELKINPQYEVLLWYPSIGHQYRIRGRYQAAEDADLVTCWNAQPASIKRVDLGYGGDFIPGQPTDNVSDFHDHTGAFLEKQAAAAPPPDHVVAAWLTATYVERMVESVDRLHDRVQYVWRNNVWHSQKLIP